MGLRTVWRALPDRLAAHLHPQLHPPPRVLVFCCPGATAVRLAAEAATAALGGQPARSAADAEVLLVAGCPGAELRSAAERLWAQLPEPRAYAEVTRPEQAGETLRSLLPQLGDRRAQAAAAADRTDEWSAAAEDGGFGGGPEAPHDHRHRAPGRPSDRPSHEGAQSHRDHQDHRDHQGHGGHRNREGGGDHESHAGHGTDHGSHAGHGTDHGSHAGHGTDHGSHAGHGTDHGSHAGHGDTGMPGGLPMAEVAEDRDGLPLDVLRVPLGPVLPHWPGGLVVDTRLQGDVVQWARARVLPSARPSGPPFWHGGRGRRDRSRRVAAAHLDSLSRLLAVAGWEPAADSARRLRDRLLAGEPEDRVHADFAPWHRRVQRSRLLRWATEGVGPISPAEAARLQVSGPAARTAPPHDAAGRLCQWLTETDGLLTGAAPPDDGPRGQGRAPSRGLLAAVVELMPGLELTAARLLVASLDPDPDELEAAAGRAGAGAGAAP